MNLRATATVAIEATSQTPTAFTCIQNYAGSRCPVTHKGRSMHYCAIRSPDLIESLNFDVSSAHPMAIPPKKQPLSAQVDTERPKKQPHSTPGLCRVSPRQANIALSSKGVRQCLASGKSLPFAPVLGSCWAAHCLPA